MKIQMGKNSIFALLLRRQWWISAGIAVVIGVVVWSALPRQYAVYGLFSSMPFLIVSVMAAWKQRGKPSDARIAAILEVARGISWRDFSVEIERALKNDGFAVKRIDQPAADFSISSNGRIALVSGKRWKAATTGIEPLRELHNAAIAAEAQDCFYITAGTFTPHAMRFAVEKKMRLVHGAGLAKLLREMALDIPAKHRT